MLKGGSQLSDWQIAQCRVYFVPLYENKKIYVCLSQVTIEWRVRLKRPIHGALRLLLPSMAAKHYT